MKELRVRSRTEVAKLAQSVAQAIRQSPVISVSAVGVLACHQAERGIGASADLLGYRPWIQVHLQRIEFKNGNKDPHVREGTIFIVARDLESAADYESSLTQSE